MADVQFEEDQSQVSTVASEQSWLIRAVLTTGLVSNTKQAQYVLLGSACLALVITAYFLLSGGSTQTLSPSDIERITNLQQGVTPP